MRPYEERLDWVYPPPGISPVSLGATLHDGYLIGASFDSAVRSARLRVRIPHLELFTTLIFTGVEALRVARSEGTPGSYYHTSIDWATFLEALPAGRFETLRSAILLEEGELSFWLGGLESNSWYELTIHAERLELEGGTSLAEFIGLGEAYWAAFGS